MYINEYTRESEVFEAGVSLSGVRLQHYFVSDDEKPFRQDWGIRDLSLVCHQKAKSAGWWDNPLTVETVPRCLMLVVSEIAEAMEGDRKDLMDDKLPERKMIEVELADAVIRIFDLAERLGLDVPGAMLEKLKYNETRKDHSLEHRAANNGKSY